MNIYLELLLVSAVVFYVVDLSGFTQSWKEGLASLISGGRTNRLRWSGRPFSCSLCMTWWCCLAWALFRGQLNLPVVAASAGFSAFSNTLYNLLIFIRESLTVLISRLNDKCNRA